MSNQYKVSEEASPTHPGEMIREDFLQALDVPIQSFFTDIENVLPLAVSEKLLLDSYRAIPNKDIQESILKITTNATRHCE